MGPFSRWIQAVSGSFLIRLINESAETVKNRWIESGERREGVWREENGEDEKGRRVEGGEWGGRKRETHILHRLTPDCTVVPQIES